MFIGCHSVGFNIGEKEKNLQLTWHQRNLFFFQAITLYPLYYLQYYHFRANGAHLAQNNMAQEQR